MTIVLTGGTLIDGRSAGPRTGQVILVEGNSIAAVGPEAGLRWPADAEVIDVGGRTLLPGFIDCHAHLSAYPYDLETRLTTPASYTAIRTTQNLRATLEAGVTTVREAGGIDAGIKLAVEHGLVPGPRLQVSIVMLAQTGAIWDLNLASGARLDLSDMAGRVVRYCDGVEPLRRAARQLLAAGADLLNIHTTSSIHMAPGKLPTAMFTPEEIATVVYEAHNAGKRVMAHVDGGPGVANAIRAGVDSVDHPYHLSDDDIVLLLAHDIFLVPTLACNYGILRVADRDPHAGIHESSKEAARRLIDIHTEGFERALKAGVKFVMGSDSFGRFQGDNLFELELMVAAGCPPMRAIQSGTSLAAQCLGLDDRIGTLEAGKLADILCVDGDPLADIRVLQDKSRLSFIMQDGRFFKNLL